MYHQLSEEEQDRIVTYLVAYCDWTAGGWMVRGIVGLEWSQSPGLHYVVEVEHEDGSKTVEVVPLV